MVTFLVTLFINQRLQSHYKIRSQNEKLLYIPSGKYLKVASLGFDQLFADLLWLKTLSYFGTHALSDRKYPWLPNLLDAIVILDPLWDFPYHFAGIILSVEGDLAMEANKIVLKGMSYHPQSWQFPFYIGFNYFHVLNNPTCGAKYIFKASTYPKAPNYLAPLAARLSAQGNSKENHLAMCNKIISMAKTKEIRERVIERCKEKLSGIKDQKNISHEPCL